MLKHYLKKGVASAMWIHNSATRAPVGVNDEFFSNRAMSLVKGSGGHVEGTFDPTVDLLKGLCVKSFH